MQGIPRGYISNLEKATSFVFTRAHEKLLRASRCGWSYVEFGAAQIDDKRPYGNGDVEADVCRILGWAKGADGEWSGAQRLLAARLHAETRVALQIVLDKLGGAPDLCGRWSKGTFGWELVAPIDASNEPVDPGAFSDVSGPQVGMVAFWRHEGSFLWGVVSGVGERHGQPWVETIGYGKGNVFTPEFWLPNNEETTKIQAGLNLAKAVRADAREKAQFAFLDSVDKLTSKYVAG
ncbi:hypothetical protein UFOVP1382_88 [uncultured Caudovirales phage]|uniref:Uncharacterized protein n=1 Tax=uncultured Caudovirales phage TaxID=2100421 RepID=A0A6J5S4I1_9CAUD|nr:hypothetical protein UFOVP1382_88 [uncultured Caudovirales phage]